MNSFVRVHRKGPLVRIGGLQQLSSLNAVQLDGSNIYSLLLRRSGQRHPRVFGDRRKKVVPPAERHKKNRRENKEKNLWNIIYNYTVLWEDWLLIRPCNIRNYMVFGYSIGVKVRIIIGLKIQGFSGRYPTCCIYKNDIKSTESESDRSSGLTCIRQNRRLIWRKTS